MKNEETPATAETAETAEAPGAGTANALLPLLRARTWSIGFLALAIVLAVVFAQTMPELFRAAHS